jgi:hypothetical protein
MNDRQPEVFGNSLHQCRLPKLGRLPDAVREVRDHQLSLYRALGSACSKQ